MSGGPAPPLLNKLVWPAIVTSLMVALTLYLGGWQVQRLAWKTALLAQIDQGELAPPTRLTVQSPAFSRVLLTGHFRSESALYGVEVRSTVTGPAMGAQLVRAFERDDAVPVMVDLGWVPDGPPPPPPEGQVTVEGYVRPAEFPVRFGAADDPVSHRFYALDPTAIGHSLALSDVAPFTVVLLGPSRPGVYPEPATALPRPVNNHFTYALTWFGMAAAGTIIFAIYARKTLRT